MRKIWSTGKKSGKPVVVFAASEEEYMQASENSGGACLACGEETDGVEPDARKYKCGACGEFRVYGFEELLTMGRVEIEE